MAKLEDQRQPSLLPSETVAKQIITARLEDPTDLPLDTFSGAGAYRPIVYGADLYQVYDISGEVTMGSTAKASRINIGNGAPFSKCAFQAGAI